MTVSTISTVSTEEVKRFAEEMAKELGIADLLRMECWAHPHLKAVELDEGPLKLRNTQLRMRIGENDKH